MLSPLPRRAMLALTALPLLLGTAGCGDDGPSSEGEEASEQTRSPDASDDSDLEVVDGTTPGDLLDCLIGAGLPAALDDALPFGVEVPVQGIEVEPLGSTVGGDSQGAALWVFTDPAAAQENRAIITLADEDGPSSWVAGNVVVDLYYPAAEGDAEVDALRACLPG